MANQIVNLAREIAALKQRVRTLGSTSQLAYSSIEGGAISAFNRDGSQTMTIGRQWDGTYTSTSQNGPTPPTPLAAVVDDATEALIIRWNGLFEAGNIAPMDFLRVDAHVGTTADFTPDHSNRVGSIIATTGGEITVGLPAGTYYVKLVCWSVAGVVSPSSGVTEADSWPVVTITDGFAPPTVTGVYAMAGIDFSTVRWAPVSNADSVTYDVHVSTMLGFTPSPATKVGETQGTQFTVRRLAGPDPEEGAEDPFALEYGVTYYVRIVARDDDGSAAPSLQAPLAIFQVTGVNLAADSVTAANILAGSLTGELFSAEVVLAGLFRAGDENGQNVQFGVFGIRGYKANGDLMINFPTEEGEEALFDGELVIRGATVLGGISIQSLGNEMTSDSQLTLQNGVTTPTASPTFAITYDTVRPSTTSLTPAQKTSNDPDWGLGGPFELAASEVSWIEWREGEQMWIFWQVRSNGTRAWFINPDGTPHNRFGAGIYFNDYKGWRVWSATEITTSTAAKNGSYYLFQFIGGAGDWYLYHSNDVPPNNGFGFNRYTPVNTSAGATPAIGTNGTDLFIAERLENGQLRIAYHAMVSDGGGGGPIPFLPAASTVLTSNTNTYAASLCAIGYDSNGYDVPYSTEGVSSRYYTGERGVAYSARLIYPNGSGVWPGSTGATLGWGGTGREAESWESPTTNRRGMAWNGTHFWTLGGDGLFYKHEDFATQWNPALTSSTWWGEISFRDDDIAGTGQHETLPGTPKSFTMRRRAKLSFTPPDLSSIDTGDPDDPNKVGLYMARKATPPSNSEYWRMGYFDTAQVFTNLVTSGDNPPTTNTFLNANPAKIRNPDETLRIDATGLVRGSTIQVGTDNVAIEGPYMYGHLNANTGNLTSGSWTNITSWTVDESSGITNSSGLFTVPRAGRYLITCILSYADGTTGVRGVTYVISGTARASVIAPATSSFQGVAQASLAYRLAAGATIRIQGYQNGGALAIRGDANGNYSNLQITYLGS